MFIYAKHSVWDRFGLTIKFSRELCGCVGNTTFPEQTRKHLPLGLRRLKFYANREPIFYQPRKPRKSRKIRRCVSPMSSFFLTTSPHITDEIFGEQKTDPNSPAINGTLNYLTQILFACKQKKTPNFWAIYGHHSHRIGLSNKLNANTTWCSVTLTS